MTALALSIVAALQLSLVPLAATEGSCVVTKVIGCFKDSDPDCVKMDCRGPRLLNHSAIKSDAQLTRARCAEACCADGFAGGFAGIEFGDECYCSHELNIPAAPAEPAADCARMKCPGNRSEDCGDSYRISVFQASCATPCQGPPPAPTHPAATLAQLLEFSIHFNAEVLRPQAQCQRACGRPAATAYTGRKDKPPAVAGALACN